jgi:glycosyltransferase involved in cell wall biosynthesis
MRILWVNPSFLDYRIPVYKKIFDLANEDFFLIYSQKRVTNRVINKITNAIGDHSMGLANEATFSIPAKGDFANTDLRLPYQPGLYDTISKVDADIIIGEGFFQWTPVALLRAKLKRKKVLIAYERTAHTERNCPKWRSVYRKVISKFVDGFLINGQLTKEYLIQLGIKENKIFIGGMSADSEDLVSGVESLTPEDRNKFRSELKIGDGLTYLYVGQITERKGVIYLLKAWEKHSKKHVNDNLIIIGTGMLLEKYRSEFSHLNSIKWTGSIDYDLIYNYYALGDVFIIPTLEDNWSLVVPEAMACGLPIACSVYNGCYPELVHDGINGKLFDPLEEDSLLSAMDYFHYADLKAMGNESIRIEKKFSAEAVAKNIYSACETFF